jgi:hypothetical protein
MRSYFFIYPSKTLILADLLERYDNLKGLARLLARVGGVDRRYALTRDQRLTYTNRRELRDSIREVLQWPIEKILLSHGPLVEKHGLEVFREAFSWLL